MFNDHSKKYQIYLDDYQEFSSQNNLGNKFLAKADLTINFSRNCRILQYNKTRFSSTELPAKVFLVVSSIFNSPEILFINKEQGFIDNLRQLGEVYLINWLEISDAAFALDDYVKEIVSVLKFLESTKKAKINLIGHCIGGNLALAAGIIAPHPLASLTLLTTPWDFSHLTIISKLHQQLNLDSQIKNLPVIPKIYLQILFFLLAPEYLSTKLDKYFKLTTIKDKQLFFQVEHWLMSGNALPSATYFQIIEDMLTKNVQEKGQWLINGKIIDPKLFNKPVCHLLAVNDKIVPENSILPLHKKLKNSIMIKLRVSHINYLISNKIQLFFEQYAKWLQNI